MPLWMCRTHGTRRSAGEPDRHSDAGKSPNRFCSPSHLHNARRQRSGPRIRSHEQRTRPGNSRERFQTRNNRDPQRENDGCISNRAWQALVHGSRGRRRRFHDGGRTPKQDLLRFGIGTSRKIQSTLFIQSRGQTGARIEGFQGNPCLIRLGRENDGSPRLRGLQYAVYQVKAVSELSPMDAKGRVSKTASPPG